MDAGNTRPELRHALAGLQAGVAGALAMIGWLMVASRWSGRSVWATPNLFATVFYGTGAYRNHYVRSTFAGVALILCLYGLAGVVWGLAVRDRRFRLLPLWGAVTGLAVYVFFFRFVWLHEAPLLTLYAPDRPLQIGHVLWGLTLAKSPVFARRIAAATGGWAGGDPAGEGARTGEVIV